MEVKLTFIKFVLVGLLRCIFHFTMCRIISIPIENNGVYARPIDRTHCKLLAGSNFSILNQ